jgi:subtilisin family serine protease
MLVYTDNAGAVHVRNVEASREDVEAARLRQMPGVRSVERAQYRHALAVNPDDPYYRGFGPGAPYFEASSQPGQWDMHVIGLGSAWSSVEHGAPIAIIDTGVDVTHPELRGGKIVRTRCFVTFPVSGPQTTGQFVTDRDGHGTNVAGIADADTNNGFGFAGVGFSAPLLAYRIFPEPPSGGCQPGTTSAQCETTDVDEVSAINDAVAHGARVINLSLGSDGPLSNCDDSIERNAIENAISHGVVVVAAAGNEGSNHLDCPAAYPGVIAVGASALLGSGNSVTEGVASYSNWVSSSGPGGGGVYLVAPGGDPSGDTDGDNLHWIENIYSSTAVPAVPCTTDLAGKSGDCRILIAGTSQATPHVAGIVSLMLGLRPSLTPGQIASDLCATAKKIGSSKEGCGRANAAAAVARAAQ